MLLPKKRLNSRRERNRSTTMRMATASRAKRAKVNTKTVGMEMNKPMVKRMASSNNSSIKTTEMNSNSRRRCRMVRIMEKSSHTVTRLSTAKRVKSIELLLAGSAFKQCILL